MVVVATSFYGSTAELRDKCTASVQYTEIEMKADWTIAHGECRLGPKIPR
jgi:hypothetical protein